MILATSGLEWSLSLTARATYPLATNRDNAGASWRRRPALPPISIGALLGVVLLLPAAAHATSGQGTIAMKKWQSMDKCAVEAQRAFPDFTAESNAKRDMKLKACLEGQNLPPRETASPAR